MGNNQTVKKINFEDLQVAIQNNEIYLIINTLNEIQQDCLIFNTLVAEKEEETINNCIQNKKYIHIIIYGKNSNDETIYKKYFQIISLGFVNVYVYVGGLFEWLLLQDIYGRDEFPTTSYQLDILKFKPNKMFGIPRLEYNK